MRGRTIERRAARVSLVNGLSTVLTLVFQFISVPVCLRYWGKESYGSWLALFSAFLLLRGLDGGFINYVGNKLNLLYHKDKAALRRHLASAVVGIVIIGSFQLLLACGSLLFLGVGNSLGINSGGANSVKTELGLVTLMLSWVLTGSYLGVVHRLLIPAGLMFQAAWWAMLFTVLQFVAIILASILRLDVLQTSFLFAAAQLLAYVSSGVYVARTLPEFYPWLSGVRVRTALVDLAHSSVVTASNVLQQIATNGAVVMISALAGPGSVPIFTTVRTVSNLWTAFTGVMTAPLLPEVVRLYVNEELDKLAAINQAFWVLAGTAVNLGALMSYPLVPVFYRYWTAHQVPLDNALFALLLASVVVTNSGALISLHLNGINKLHIVLGTSVVRAACALGGGAIGYRFIGLSAFGVGILAGEIIVVIWMGLYFVRRELQGRADRVTGASVGAVVLGTGATVVFFVGAALNLWSLGIVWLAALVSVTAAAIWGWSGLDAEIRQRLSNLALKWVRPG